MSVTETLTPFERELRARGLTKTVAKICAPACLRPDDLLHTKHNARGAPVILKARIKLARHLLARGWSYPMIARLLGYKEHSSVMHIVAGKNVKR